MPVNIWTKFGKSLTSGQANLT